MCQKIQRLMFFSVSMSMLLLVCEPVIPSIQSALAATSLDTVTIPQNSSPEKSQLASPMQTLPSTAPMGQLTSEMPKLTPLAPPPLTSIPSPSLPIPAIGVSSQSFSFSTQQGNGSSTTRTLTVTNIGRGTLNWNAAAPVPWLTLSPASGKDTGSIVLTVSAGSLAMGTYNTAITISAVGTAAVTIPVNLTVEVALTASPGSVTYTATQGAANPSAKTIAISSNGTWTVSDGASWLSLSPTSGSNNGTITARINTANAIQGNNSTTITVKSGGITKTVNVTLTLNAPSVTLTWNANTESDLAGYRVYRATSSGTYGAPIATIQGNTASYVATGLQSSTTYFFVVTAFDIAGNESSYSNEVSKSIY